jgi:hypothetical protein
LAALAGHLVRETENTSQLLADPRLRDESANPPPDHQEPVAYEVLSCLPESRSADAVPIAQLSFRRKALARPKFAFFDAARQVLFYLPIEGDAAIQINRSLTPSIFGSCHVAFALLVCQVVREY